MVWVQDKSLDDVALMSIDDKSMEQKQAILEKENEIKSCVNIQANDMKLICLNVELQILHGRSIYLKGN